MEENDGEDMNIFYTHNRSTENQIMKAARASWFTKSIMPPRDDLRIDYPHVATNSHKLNYDDFKDLQKWREPTPPKQRNAQQRRNLKLVRWFSKRFNYLWILIVQRNQTKIRKSFEELYEEEKMRSPNEQLHNLITAEETFLIKNLTEEKMSVKLIFDYASFQRSFSNKRSELEDNVQVKEVYVEAAKVHGKQMILPGKKIKLITDIQQLFDEKVHEDVKKSMKNVPYDNFVHLESSGELFNRRSLIQGCLYEKTKEQMFRYFEEIQQIIEEYQQSEKKRVDRMREQAEYKHSQIDQKDRRQEEQRRKRREGKNKQFIDTFRNCLQQFPFHKEELKSRVYRWAIERYGSQSDLYYLLNKTIRESLSKEKIQSFSPYIQILYDALRFYFVRDLNQFNYKQPKYKEVYRGGRASLIEKKQFTEGKYLWNLGFMSTSRNLTQAKKFLSNNIRGASNDEKIFIIIEIFKEEGIEYSDYLEEMEGFYAIDTIGQINISHPGEEEVLFNPLNTFQIISWDPESDELRLKYAPHIDILEKKRRKQSLSEGETSFLYSLSKLKNKNYDKGAMLLEEGDPNAAINYYETSKEKGDTLSTTQKQNHLQSLAIIGDVETIDELLHDELKKDENKTDENQGNRGVDDIEESYTALSIYEQAGEFEQMNKKAEECKDLITNINQVESPENLMLEISTLLKLATAKFQISETLQSFEESIRAFRLIDELANTNFCFKIFDIGNTILKLKLQGIEKMPRIKFICNDKKVKECLSDDLSRLREDTSNIVRHTKTTSPWDKEKTEDLGSNTPESREKLKGLIDKELTNRNKRTNRQEVEKMVIECYWELENAMLIRPTAQQRQEMKKCRKELRAVKDGYKKAFELEDTAYETIYSNMYKTSIKVQKCLESYKEFMKRYERFMEAEYSHGFNQAEYANVLLKTADILFECGQILGDKSDKSSKNKAKGKNSEISAMEKTYENQARSKIERAKQIFKELQKKQKQLHQKQRQQLQKKKKQIPINLKQNQQKFYTHQVSRINSTLSKYLKGKVIDSEREKKIAISQKKIDLEPPQELTENYSALLDCLRDNQNNYEEDKNMKQAHFKVISINEQLSTINQSENIKIAGEQYLDRLKRGTSLYQSAVKAIQPTNSKQPAKANLHTCQLNLLMAENQLKLGLNDSASGYLEICKNQLNIVLKPDLKPADRSHQKQSKFNRKKLLYGNKVKIGCLKLQAYLLCHISNKKVKKQFLAELIEIKNFISKKMNQPLNQAQVCESIGLLMTNISIRYAEMNYSKFQQIMNESIEIRKYQLGPYNRRNAIVCTIAFLFLSAQNLQNNAEQFYKKGKEVYLKINYKENPNMILYYGRHESEHLMRRKKVKAACQVLHESFSNYSEHKNKIMDIQVLRIFKAGAMYMTDESKFKEKGIKWLEKCVEFIDQLEKRIHITTRRQGISEKGNQVAAEKREVLEHLIALHKSQKNSEKLKKYQDILYQH